MIGVKKRKQSFMNNKKDLIFYALMLIWPIAQFLVFYVGVNFNSILLSFQKIDIVAGTVTWTFDNITKAFNDITGSYILLQALKYSLLSFVIIQGIGIPMGLVFSYYIYKKMPGSGAFRVLLFLPSIISAIVMITIFQFFVERAIPAYAKELFGITMKGLLENSKTEFGTIMFYNIWVGFATSILLYSNGMSSTDPEIVESAHIDGAIGIREFWHITLPATFPTLSTFIIAAFATICSNQIGLYSFYGSASNNITTYGYYLYTHTQAATSRAEYPPLSALGLLLTIVTVPITLLVRRLLEKFGPSEN